MKYVLKFLEIIFNPFFSVLTANENNSNKTFLQNLKKNHFFLLFISALITIGIVLFCYHKEIFGV